MKLFWKKYECNTSDPLVGGIMSEVLRAPWLLQTVLDDLSNDQTTTSGLNHLHRTPKLLQIIQVKINLESLNNFRFSL